MESSISSYSEYKEKAHEILGKVGKPLEARFITHLHLENGGELPKAISAIIERVIKLQWRGSCLA